MFQKFMGMAALKVLQMAMCQFFGFCMEHEECPDGVCTDVLKESDRLLEGAPEATADPTRTQAIDIKLDWSKFDELAKAARSFMSALRAFLGLGTKVGTSPVEA